MLKIVTLGNGHGTTTLILEGRLVGPWVEELRLACEKALASSAFLELDLSTVTFLDRQGVDLLRDLAGRRVSIVHCTPFVAEQLRAAER
jgi:anti-anti-sigma regulatory factor